jgi:hypothetical protein
VLGILIPFVLNKQATWKMKSPSKKRGLSLAKIKRFALFYGKIYPWIQASLFAIVALLLLWVVIHHPFPEITSWRSALVYKSLLYITALLLLAILICSPIVWFKMMEVAPQAMALLIKSKRVLFLFCSLVVVAYVYENKISRYSRLKGQELFQSGCFCFTHLFRVSSNPYLLFPLSCCLLE